MEGNIVFSKNISQRQPIQRKQHRAQYGPWVTPQESRAADEEHLPR